MTYYILWGTAAVYVAGFVLTFWFNAALGMVTLGLTLLRAVVWPVYWLTGWPRGVPLPMD